VEIKVKGREEKGDKEKEKERMEEYLEREG